MIPVEQWKWMGFPAHFIGADRCRFRLATQIGGVIISTIGHMVPPSEDYPPELIGKSGLISLGYLRDYETAVFAVGSPCGCGCGEQTIDVSRELSMTGYNSIKDATDGHMAVCRKWAELDGIAPEEEQDDDN